MGNMSREKLTKSPLTRGTYTEGLGIGLSGLLSRQSPRLNLKVAISNIMDRFDCFLCLIVIYYLNARERKKERKN